jgi:medium-chain acyl-[acyl-carrier-protein] hydrolase
MPHRWFPFDEITTDPEIRVFCFAHAGGNASFFRDWRGTADLVEFYPVQLPGHGTRLSEPPLTRLEDIVDAFAEAAEPLLDRPFALFGHSFGAWLAYAAAQQIRTQYGQPTRHLFVSGNVPPPKTPILSPSRLASIDEAENYMVSLGGTASDLIDDKELLSILVPIFMNDINLLRAYHDNSTNILKCPITAFLGKADPLHTLEGMGAWESQTSDRFVVNLLPGNHFYLEDNRNELVELITMSLQA